MTGRGKYEATFFNIFRSSFHMATNIKFVNMENIKRISHLQRKGR